MEQGKDIKDYKPEQGNCHTCTCIIYALVKYQISCINLL